ncbi:GNAT family N-acetyltransferase [Tenacibaculum xiamenense]|uniref:GNAT family N-acetyltransferase n=1 Tax=Tenacibaculum xiamenense TaxID=1261553 RepID=UPI00389505EE
MNIRPYKKKDRAACMEIIKSNTPEFFAMDEVPLFEEWLIAQEKGLLAHDVSEKEYYFVLEDDDNVLGCAGYLLVKNSNEIFLSWGMVNRKFQKLGYGKKLLEYRFKSISQNYPDKKIALATTQDIAPFFEKYGFKTTNIKPKFYSESLDRYEMEK